MSRHFDLQRLVQELVSAADDARADAALTEITYRQQQAARVLADQAAHQAHAARLNRVNQRLQEFHEWVKTHVRVTLDEWHRHGTPLVRAQLTHCRTWANELDAVRKLSKFRRLSDHGFYLQTAQALVDFTSETVVQAGAATVNVAGLPTGHTGSIADLMREERRDASAETIRRCRQLQRDERLGYEIFLMKRFAGRGTREIAQFTKMDNADVNRRFEEAATFVDAA